MSIPKSGLQLTRYEPSQRETWDRFVAQARNRSFLFSRDYIEYHGDRFVDHSIVVSRNGTVVALMPANQEGEILHSHQGLTFGGIIVAPKFRMEHALALVDALVVYGRCNGLSRLVYRPAPHCYHLAPTEEDIVALLGAGAVISDTRGTSVLDLAAPTLRTPGRKRELSIAAASGLAISRDDDFAGFMSFCARFLEQRHGAKPVHAGAEMERLAQRFDGNIKLYLARRADVVLAGVIAYDNPTCVRLQYVASRDEGHRDGTVGLLYDHIIKDHCSVRRWLDFGPSVDPHTRAFNANLGFYKESFGARTIAQLTYQLAF